MFEGGDTDKLDLEAGGHRIQRIPPTERRGRVHSSTVTVAVLRPGQCSDDRYRRRTSDDYLIEWYSGTIGAGGQNHQKTQNCARVTHVPTGLVRTAQTRSRQSSLKAAMAALTETLDIMADAADNAADNRLRRGQVGSGERSDKRRTYRFQDGLVHDHCSGRSGAIERVMSGRFDLLWA